MRLETFGWWRMVYDDMYVFLREKFKEIIVGNNFCDETVKVEVKVLSKEEAIGGLEDKEFALVRGDEKLIEARFRDAVGHAFTDEPSSFHGKLRDVLKLPLETNRERALFIASLNAVMKYLGLVKNTRHCKDDGPWICAEKLREHVSKKYGKVKVAIIGYQPAFVKILSERFTVRVTDMNPKNIGKVKFGVKVEDASRNFEVAEWADLILATGSMIINDTLKNILHFKDKIVLYGVTCAGAAKILGFRRWCTSEQI